MNSIYEAYDMPAALRDSESVGDEEDCNALQPGVFEPELREEVPRDAYLEPAFCPTEAEMEELRSALMESYVQEAPTQREGATREKPRKSLDESGMTYAMCTPMPDDIGGGHFTPPDDLDSYLPSWATKQGIDEHRFIQYYILHHTICYWNGYFHDKKGVVPDDVVRREIGTLILPYVKRGLDRTINSLVGSLRIFASVPAPVPDKNSIPVANGTLQLVQTKTIDPSSAEGSSAQEDVVSVRLDPMLDWVDYRLPVEFHERTARCVHWLDFLDALLEPDDIDTLQEYMGYLLLPSTKAQKMLCIIGQGGEGKSVIGSVLRSILGNAVWFSSIQKIENNRFARADLSGKLCMIDDDMQMNALSSTGILKSLVTSTGKMDVERKGRQSTQEEMYCRFLCFGNGSLTALYDRSNGFYRRQLVIKTKPKDKNRVDDPWLTEKLEAEKEGIFLWMVAGLIRLVEQNYRFTVSDQAKQNLREMYFENNNVEEFLRDTSRLSYGTEEQITSKRLCIIYRKWCEDNGLRPIGDQAVVAWIRENGRRFGIAYKKNITENGTNYRGFVGVSGRMM